MDTHYTTIEKPATGEFRDRGSKFIAFAYPLINVEEFKPLLANLKKEHPKANHHCFAYRIGTDGKVFRVSDDGEPSGSAGRPILGQIDSRKLTNTLVVVVRYFGGTLLGVPGLINAYKTSTALSLDAAGTLVKPILQTETLEFDYTLMNDVMRIVKQYDCIIIRQESGLFCKMEVGIPILMAGEVRKKFSEVRGVIMNYEL